MNKEKKNKEKEKKILAFDISDEALYDPEMDAFLRDNIKRDADDLEEKLNQKPSLRGVGASDDLFLSIVGQLKEQGIWEEDPVTEEAAEHISETEMKKDDVPKRESENELEDEFAERSQRADVMVNTEKTMKRDEVAGVCADEAEKSNEVAAEHVSKRVQNNEFTAEDAGKLVHQCKTGAEQKMSGYPGGKVTAEYKEEMQHNYEGAAVHKDAPKADMSEKKSDMDTIKSMQNEFAQIPDIADGIRLGQSNETVTEERDFDRKKGQTVSEIPSSIGNAENTEKTDKIELSIDEIYDRLSEKDRKTLELGRKIEQKQETRRIKWRRRKKFLKPFGTVAAILVIVLGVGMSTEANRRLILRAWETVVESIGFSTRTDLVEESDRIYSKTKEESEAWQEIESTIGILEIDFGYMPSGMKFLRYESNGNSELGAVFFYSYQDKIMSIEMIKINNEAVSYYILDNETVLRDTIIIDQDISVDIWETNLDLEEETYVAMLEYEGCRYIINGMISLEEMTKMVKSIYFL